jgi:integration host factor subunit beta
MVKSELIANLKAANPNLPAKDIEAMVSRLFELVSEALVKGERVELRGLGTFHLGSRSARRMVDPRTGAERGLPSRRTILFKPGVWFKAGQDEED